MQKFINYVRKLKDVESAKFAQKQSEAHQLFLFIAINDNNVTRDEAQEFLRANRERMKSEKHNSHSLDAHARFHFRHFNVDALKLFNNVTKEQVTDVRKLNDRAFARQCILTSESVLSLNAARYAKLQYQLSAAVAKQEDSAS